MMRGLYFLTMLLLVGGLAACGGEEARSCYVVDRAGSTREMQVAYGDLLEGGLAEDAEAGRAAAVLIARGDPYTESIVEKASFAGLDTLEEQEQRDSRLLDLLSRLDDVAADIDAGLGARTTGSAIVDSMVVMAESKCTTMTVLSDGLETEVVNLWRDDILSERGRTSLAEKLKLPDLQKVKRVSFPYGGKVKTGSKLPKDRKRAIQPLWETIVEESGSTLTWGEGA